MTRLIFVVLAVAFLVARINGQTILDIYADSTNGIAGDGSTGNPYKSIDVAFSEIQTRLATATSYNLTLHIKAGSYNFNSAITVSPSVAQRLTIRGEGGYALLTSISGSGFAFGGQYEYIEVNYVSISGCTSSYAINVSPSLLSNTVVLNHLQISQCSTGTNPVVNLDNTNAFITDLDFTQNSANGATGVFLITRGTGTSSTVRVQNSKFHANTMGAPLIWLGDSVTLENIDIYGNTDASNGIIQIQSNYADGQTITLNSVRINDNVCGSIINSASGVHTNYVLIDKNTIITENSNAGSIIEAATTNDYLTVDVNALLAQNDLDQLDCTGGGHISDNYESPHSLCNLGPCASNTKFDRCYVCGGSSACVGCDNIPYSGVTCVLDSSEDDNNTDPTDSVAEWADGYPNPTLRPIAGSSYFVQVTTGKIEERTPSGQVVKSIDMSNVPWQVTEPVQPDTTRYVRSYLYYLPVDPFTKVQVSQVLYRVTEDVTSGGVTFTVQRNALKFSIEVANWELDSTANNLAFDLTFTLSEGFQSETTTSTTISGFDITTLNVSTPNTVATVNLQNFAVVDGVTKAIEVKQISSTATTRVFDFSMPAGDWSKWQYDPDFGVITTPTDSGDGGSDNTGLIVGLTVGLSVFALLVVVVIIVGAVLFGWLKIHRHNRVSKMRGSMVNFHNEEEEAGGSDSSD